MTLRLLRHVAAAAALLFLALPAAAQPTPAHLALAQEVAVNSGITRSFDSVTDDLVKALNEMQIARPEIKKDLDEVIELLKPELELQKRQMVNASARAFAAQLTEAELRDIVTFFKSPSGRKYVDRQPPVFDEIVKTMKDWSRQVQEYVLVRAKAEMGKRGHQLQ